MDNKDGNEDEDSRGVETMKTDELRQELEQGCNELILVVDELFRRISSDEYDLEYDELENRGNILFELRYAIDDDKPW